jgi:hypothetical protein
MHARKSFSVLWLLLPKLLLACAVFGLPTAIALAEDMPPRAIEVHFGQTTLTLDRELVLGSVARSLLRTRQELDIESNDAVQVALPPKILASFSPPCEAIRSAFLVHETLPRRADRRLFSGLHPKETSFEGISKLEPASGAPLIELYQFDSDQLRDFWGDPISFYKAGPLFRLDLQVTSDLRVQLGTSASDCFFKRGSVFAAQLRAFILSRIKSHP